MRLINADALIDRLRNDPLFEAIKQFGVIEVIEAEPSDDPCEEIAKMCFGKAIEKEVEAHELEEFCCRDISNFTRGEAFAYRKMNKWIQGFARSLYGTSTERKE